MADLDYDDDDDAFTAKSKTKLKRLKKKLTHMTLTGRKVSKNIGDMLLTG